MNKENAMIKKIYDLRIVFLVIVLITLFSILTERFFSLRTVNTLLLLLPSNGIVVLGVTLVMIIGELDLSVGGILALSGLILVKLLPLGVFPSIIITLLIGSFIGFINGFIVYKLKVSSLITTIAVGFILSGVSFLISEGTIYFENSFLSKLGNSSLWIFPYSTILYLVLTAVIQFVLKRTTFGIKLYSVGGSKISSIYSGIRVNVMGIGIFMLSGLFSSLGGIILSSRLATASPIYGSDTAIFVITAVLLGGTNIGGGKGDVVKSFLGILLLSLLTKGLTQLEVPAFYQNMIIGVILISLLYFGKRLEMKDN